MTDLDRDLELLATPPAISDRFEIEDISFTSSIAHPVLGAYWADFHDRLHWSKDDQQIKGAEEGVNLFLLACRFLDQDHRIIAMPPPREAAERVWDAHMRQLAPEYLKAWRIGETSRGALIDQVPPVLPAQTIHGCKTLLANAVPLRRKLVAAFKGYNPGHVHFEGYLDRAIDRVARTAERYDPSRNAKFTTYVHKPIRGAYLDWLEVASGAYLHAAPLDSAHSFAPGGQQSVITMPSDDFAVERIVDRRVHWDEKLRKQIKAEANLNLFQEVVFDNLLSPRPRTWKAIAEQLGISSKDEIYVLKSRTERKIAPVLRRLFFVRPKHK
jgi:hypothetical protein